jgi:hypothetical protein
VIADGLPPGSPVFLILPFKDLPDFEIPGIPGIGKMDNTKTAAADIGNYLPFFQRFPFADAGNNTVKMNRFPGIPVRYGRGKVFDRFTAIWAVRGRKRFGGKLGRGPAGPFIETSPVFLKPGRFPGTDAMAGISGPFLPLPGILPIIIVPVLTPERPPAVISSFSAAQYSILPGIYPEAHYSR